MAYRAADERDDDSGRRRARERIHRSEEEQETASDSSDRIQRLDTLRGPGTVQSVDHGCTAGLAADQASGARSGRVAYDDGPTVSRLAAEYDLEIQSDSHAARIRRLESDFGTRRVQRWADEGMTVETMGKPQDMRAFREAKAARPEDIPADIERRNQASIRRNRDTGNDGSPAGDAGVPDVVRQVVSSPGQSMDEGVQREMESKMGEDFSDVQLHTGPTAAAAAKSINARAFTVGNHVAFNSAEYRPGTDAGKKVLAHELTHVRQQNGGRVTLLPKADAERVPGIGPDAVLQPKLEVSSPDDPAEKEAERVAEAVMEMDDSSDGEGSNDGTAGAAASAATGDSGVSRDGDASAASGGEVDGNTESAVREGVSGAGKPIPSDTRSRFESAMGADFSDVSVHTGPTADAAAKSIQAEAYTLGSDIAFSEGAYQPGTARGQEVLAHELTHVTQQTTVSRVHRIFGLFESNELWEDLVESGSNEFDQDQFMSSLDDASAEDRKELAESPESLRKLSTRLGRSNMESAMEKILADGRPAALPGALAQVESDIPAARWKAMVDKAWESADTAKDTQMMKRLIEVRFNVDVTDLVNKKNVSSSDQFFHRVDQDLQKTRYKALTFVYDRLALMDEEGHLDPAKVDAVKLFTQEGSGGSITLGSFDPNDRTLRLNALVYDMLRGGTVLHELAHGLDFPGGGAIADPSKRKYSTTPAFMQISGWDYYDNASDTVSALEQAVDDPMGSFHYNLNLDADAIRDFAEKVMKLTMEGSGIQSTDFDAEFSESDVEVPKGEDLDQVPRSGYRYMHQVKLIWAILQAQASTQHYFNSNYSSTTEPLMSGSIVHQGYAKSDIWWKYNKGKRGQMVALTSDGYSTREPGEEFAETFAKGYHPNQTLPNSNYERYFKAILSDELPGVSESDLVKQQCSR